MSIRDTDNSITAMTDREYWQQERKRILKNFLVFFAAVVVVLLAVGTAAWLAANKKVSGNNMLTSVQDGDLNGAHNKQYKAKYPVAGDTGIQHRQL